MTRPILAALLSLALTSTPAAAAPELRNLSPDLAREYVRPHDLVDIGGGRKLNLFCMGSGDRTVLFDAGGSDWSVIWALVQPEVAKGARACAYDRAGLGYSDPAMLPRTPAAIADDLHALIIAAKLPRPMVLVGHSLGGFNVKLHAALYPEDVAGLVLVDPSEERAADRTRALLRRKYGAGFTARSELLDHAWMTMLLERYRRCAEAGREGPLDPTTLTYRRCSDPPRAQLGDAVAAERQRIQVGETYQAAQASEILNSIYGDLRGEPIYADLFRPGAFGRKPMIVLTHGVFDPEDPLDAAAQTQIVALHAETARLSRNGRQRTVPDTGHHIELQDPQAIVDAIATVLDEVAAAKRKG